jgi:ElaB/YqjD/DUF883 family membrane-anchored ribosome-binding protein
MADRTATTVQDEGQSQDTAQTSDLQNQVHELGTQMRDWAQDVGGQLKEGVQEARRQVETSASQLSAQGHEAVGQLEKTLEAYIRAKPLQSLMIAAGLGMVVGLLWRR